MYALRERRVHVTQEDFEMAVTKVCTCPAFCRIFSVIVLKTRWISYRLMLLICVYFLGHAKGF